MIPERAVVELRLRAEVILCPALGRRAQAEITDANQRPNRLEKNQNAHRYKAVPASVNLVSGLMTKIDTLVAVLDFGALMIEMNDATIVHERYSPTQVMRAHAPLKVFAVHEDALVKAAGLVKDLATNEHRGSPH